MTQVATQSQNNAVAKPTSLKGLLDSDSIKKRFDEMLGQKAAGFISSILTVVNGNPNLRIADPQTIIAAAAVAASLDLPINQNLGFAYIIPYKTKYTDDQGQMREKYVAQFQMGYKGFIQLAKRSGQYIKINAMEIRKGQLVKANPLTEEFEFDFSNNEGEVIGFAAYMKEVNGFEKTLYWNVGQVVDHAKRFSKAYKDKSSPWTTDFDKMAKKTLLKGMISTFGTLSIDIQKAVAADQAVVKDMEGKDFEYADSVDVTNQKGLEAEIVVAEEMEEEQSGSQSNDLSTDGI